MNSVVRDGIDVKFKVEDHSNSFVIKYTGILPDLFREGQGIIAMGSLKGDHFKANEVLAKHDENYMPPEVAEALKVQKESEEKAYKAKHTNNPG